MNIDRLISSRVKQDISTDVMSVCVQQLSIVKQIMRKLFSAFGVSLIKKTTLEKLDCLKAGMERNAQFARTFILERAGIDALYSSLTDDASKLSLDRYISYRFSLPLFYDAKQYSSYALNTGYLLEKYRAQDGVWVPSLKGADNNIIDIVIAQTFIAKQYMFDNSTLVSTGDTILDCGCFLGETAIYFAKLCGESGRVYTFEPDKTYFEAARENIKRNGLENNAEVVNAATISPNGNADYSPCYKDKDACSIPTTTIDEFCLEKGVRVDIIKMDIEGAEHEALTGAINTIKRDKPILMISAYHKPEDLFVLPEFINSLDCGYDIYFRDRADFVLFAIPTARKERLK